MVDLIVGIEDSLALDSINLDIHKGEFVGIRGDTGGGKSTLLNTIVGLIPSTEGCISKHNVWRRI